MNSGIYGLIDPRTNELRYIGLSSKLSIRRRDHRSTKGPRLNQSTYYSNWKKQLINSGLKPEFIILEYCDITDLADNEQFWINYFKGLGCRLVNLTDGGEGVLGHRHSEESLNKMSRTWFHKDQIPWNKGLTLGPSYNKGLNHTPESKRKMSISKLGKKVSTRRCSLIDNFGNIYPSIRNASIKTNISIKRILRCIKQNISYNGYSFKKVV